MTCRSPALRCAGDDLIGPRDIKKGLHMLANANVKELEEEEEEGQDTEVDLEANRQKRIKKKDKTDTLTSEQMNQVHHITALQCARLCVLSVCITLHTDMLDLSGRL